MAQFCDLKSFVIFFKLFKKKLNLHWNKNSKFIYLFQNFTSYWPTTRNNKLNLERVDYGMKKDSIVGTNISYKSSTCLCKQSKISKGQKKKIRFLDDNSNSLVWNGYQLLNLLLDVDIGCFKKIHTSLVMPNLKSKVDF